MSPPANGQSGGGSIIPTLIMFSAIFLIFYFLIIRPQQKKQKERDRLLGEIKKGDRVVTSSGIHGTVSSVEDKAFIVQVADNVKLKFEKSAVTTVVKE